MPDDDFISKFEGCSISGGDEELLQLIKKNNIVMTDDDGTYQVYCSANPQTEFELSIRGYIFKGDQLVYRGFPFTEEMTTKDVHRLATLDLSQLNMSWSFEGTIVKFLFLDGKWRMTTHRKLDAFRSRWTCNKSFGQLFVEALTSYGFDSYESFLSQLDTERRYHFILINNEENRIVIRPELQKERIYLVLFTDTKDQPVVLQGSVGAIPVNESLHFEEVNDLIKAVDAIDPFEKQGILLFSSDYRKQYRVLNARYSDYSAIRNNISCMKFCYCINRKNPENRKKYIELYPKHIEIANWFESRIDIIAEELFSVYKQRYIRHNHVMQTPERHGILQKLQREYMETRKRVTLLDVVRCINTYEFPARVFKIVTKTDMPY